MRTIRFRAWDKKNKWMDDEIFVGPHGIYERASKTYDTPNLEIEPSENFVLMQFTGLHDRNGNEIYEGEAHEAKTVASIDAKTLFDSWNERRKVKRLFRRLLRSLGRRQSPSKK